MANRGYKLQEFVAHSSDIRCLNIGKKSCRVFLTGGEDRKVNLWAFGKPNSLLSLSGHTSSVESVIFDSTEVLVLSGSSNGTIKLWDLEEAKIVRTLTAHRSSCSSVGFHPFGEFFASGSLDTDLKIWDIRKKGCIHTYKGHSRGIRAIKFTPDGRWVVTGGDDNVVKVWDLTAGKLLHDFEFHIGPISCIDFHPQEFLLATGSADRTVKFWDLETFELIGSAGPEATGVRSTIFHRDGRTLFCGLEETLKVLSWEPIRCHDVIDMGWSTLADLSIYEGKLFGCSFHQNCVGVWVSDLSLIEPYALGGAPKKNDLVDAVYIHGDNDFAKLSVSNPISSATLSTNDFAKLTVSNPISSATLSTNDFAKLSVSNPISSATLSVVTLDCGNKTKETMTVPYLISNQCSQGGMQDTDSVHASSLSLVDSSGSKRNKATVSSRSTPQKFDSKVSSRVSTLNSTRIGKATQSCPNFLNKVDSSFSSREVSPSSTTSCESRPLTPKEALDRKAFTRTKAQPTGGAISVPVIVPRDKELVNSVNSRKETGTTKRSFGTVPRKSIHAQKPSLASGRHDSQLAAHSSQSYGDIISSSGGRRPNFLSRSAANGETTAAEEENRNITRPVAEKSEKIVSLEQPIRESNEKYVESICSGSEINSVKYVRGVAVPLGKTRSLVESWEKRERCSSGCTATTSSSFDDDPGADISSPLQNKLSGCSVEQKGHDQNFDRDSILADDNYIPEAPLENHDPFQKGQFQNFDGDSTPADDNYIPEALLENHDLFINAVKSRLTKLQMVRRYWENNGINGAISAAAKLPDHSVQVDVISVLMEKVELFTLDLFLCLLPQLAGILNSKTERHITIVLEMLLKLLKVFGSVIRLTTSAPSLVGVDLEAERRYERCTQCFIQLQKIKQILPLLIRRGGLLAKHAQGLNVALHDL